LFACDLGCGFVFFDTNASWNTITGVGLAFCGCLLYAWLKDREMRKDITAGLK